MLYDIIQLLCPVYCCLCITSCRWLPVYISLCLTSVIVFVWSQPSYAFPVSQDKEERCRHVLSYVLEVRSSSYCIRASPYSSSRGQEMGWYRVASLKRRRECMCFPPRYPDASLSTPRSWRRWTGASRRRVTCQRRTPTPPSLWSTRRGSPRSRRASPCSWK